MENDHAEYVLYNTSKLNSRYLNNRHVNKQLVNSEN